MMLLPQEVSNYVAELPYPAGLVGCRAASDNNRILSHPCCEYDIAVFGKGENRLEKIGEHVVELIFYFNERPRDHIITLKGTSITQKTALSFSIASELKDMTDSRFKSALHAFGRKMLIDSLFCQQKFRLAAGEKDRPQQQQLQHIGSMWLKIASYQLITGMLAIFGERPMPLHELAQTRRANLPSDLADGIQAALECIGIERATRPAIHRSLEAILELKSNDYDKELVRNKVQYTLDKSMLADCYYYLGKIAAVSLRSRDTRFFTRYAKLVQLAMDLSNDRQQMEKIQKSLSLATKKGLKLDHTSANFF